MELLIPPPEVSYFGKSLDLMILVVAGGQERTEEEYAELFGKSGYRLARVVPTDSPVSVMDQRTVTMCPSVEHQSGLVGDSPKNT